MKLFREYVLVSLASVSVPAEQKSRLAKELEEYERDHSSKYDKRAKPDDDDDFVGETQKSLR